MGLKHLHWLEITEYSFLVFTLVGIVFAITSQQMSYALVPMACTLILNRINRFRLEYHLRGKIFSLLKGHRQSSETLKVLEERQQTLETDQGKVTEQLAASETGKEAQAIAALQEYLASVEKSLSSVVQYLNRTTLPERVESLEKESSQLMATLNQLSRHLPEEEDLSVDEVPSVSVSPQPTIIPAPSIVSASTTQQWKCIHILKEHTDKVTGLAMSPDGRFLGSVSWDKTLRLWEVATGKLVRTQKAEGKGFLTVTWRQNHLATGGFDHTIQLWNSKEGEDSEIFLDPKPSLSGHQGSVRSLIMTSDGNTLLSGSYDQTIKQWQLDKGESIQSWYDQSGPIYAIALKEEGNLFASSGGDGCITLWKMNQETPWKILTGNVDSIESLSFQPQGKRIAAGCIDGSLKLWNLDSEFFSPDLVLNTHQGAVHQIIFSQDGETLISGGADGAVKFWQLREDNPVLLALLEDPNQRSSSSSGINTITLAPDEELLATGSLDGTIRIWLRN